MENFQNKNRTKLDIVQKIIDNERPSSGKNTIVNYGFIVLKTSGILLVFLLTKYLLVFLLGSRISDYTDNYWIFVCAGLIPACIARIKGQPFWGWWMLGTYCPIISIAMAISLNSADECSEETKVSENGQGSVEQNDIDSKIK